VEAIYIHLIRYTLTSRSFEDVSFFSYVGSIRLELSWIDSAHRSSHQTLSPERLLKACANISHPAPLVEPQNAESALANV
jgi:hypothetical protein